MMTRKILHSSIKKLRYFVWIAALCCWTTAHAQQQVTVTGSVTDIRDAGPLPNVSVTVKGTSAGIQTDAKGKYAIQVRTGQILVFRFVGYSEKQVTVTGQKVVNVSLESAENQLESVVVVGYGTQKKRDVTSAISSVKGEELTDRPVAGVTGLLQGKVSGLNITSDGGEPGGGAKVRIRGIGTLTNNDPLYIIDGGTGQRRVL